MIFSVRIEDCIEIITEKHWITSNQTLIDFARNPDELIYFCKQANPSVFLTDGINFSCVCQFPTV